MKQPPAPRQESVLGNIGQMLGTWFGLFKSQPFGTLSDGSVRPYWPVERIDDSNLLNYVNGWNIDHIISCSQKLVENYGPIKGAIHDKATWCIGRAWLPIFRGKDKDWGRKAAQWLRDEWYPVADVRGLDFVSSLWVASVTLDRDGSFLVLLTETETGYPQIQCMSGCRLETWNDKPVVDSGPYKGLRIQRGIIINAIGRPVAFRVRQDDNTSTDISARSLIYVNDPDFFGQLVGWPSTAHGIDTLKTMFQAQEWEEQASAMASAIGMIETNEQGGPDPDDPRNTLTSKMGPPAAPGGPPTRLNNPVGIAYQKIVGGLIRYFKAKSGAKIDTFKSERPGDAWESFHDRLMRITIEGMGWVYEMSWKTSNGTGPEVRLRVLGKLTRTVLDRQGHMMPTAKRIVGYAIARAMKQGILEHNDEWWKWDFTLPPKPTIDFGRDVKAQLQELATGSRTLTAHLGEQGIDLEDWLNEKADELDLIDACAKRTGRDPAQLFNPQGDMRGPAAEPDLPDPEPTPEVAPAKPAKSTPKPKGK